MHHTFSVPFLYQVKLRDPDTGTMFNRSFLSEAAVDVPVVSSVNAPVACTVLYETEGSDVWCQADIRYARGKLWIAHLADPGSGTPESSLEAFQSDLSAWASGTPLTPYEYATAKGDRPADHMTLKAYLAQQGWDSTAVISQSFRDLTESQTRADAESLLVVQSDNGMHVYRRTHVPYYEVQNVSYEDGLTECHVVVRFDNLDHPEDEPDFTSPEFWRATELKRARRQQVDMVRGGIDIKLPDLPFWAQQEKSFVRADRPQALDFRA